MANIRLDLNRPITDGETLTFRSPANFSEITGLKVYYTDGDTVASKVFEFADAHGNNVGSIDLFASDVMVKVVVDTELNRAYVQNADTNGYLEKTFAGRTTEQGGEIFGDYATNQANAEFATAFGSNSRAFAPGAFAAGFRIAKSGANITYDENGRQVPEHEEDWRYNEAYGYGSEAFGKGAVAYSRASKSLGYRTQTGYPLSSEIAALRPEAILCPLPFNILEPHSIWDPIGNNISIFDTGINFHNHGCKVTYPISRGKLKFAIAGTCGSTAELFGNRTILVVEYYSDFIDDAEGGTVVGSKRYEFRNHELPSEIVSEIPLEASFICIRCSDDQGEGQLDINISTFEYYPNDNKGQGAFAIGADTAALGNHAFAGGWGSIARGYHSFAFGGHNEASGEYSVAFGNETKSSGYAAVTFGDKCEATKENCFAGGTNSKATAGNSIAFGYGCIASTRRTVALGSEANASGEMGATAIGHQVTAYGKGATAMGSGTYAKGEGTFAVGAGTQATLYGAFAYGDHCIASNYNAIAGGANSRAELANSAAIGRRVVTSRSSQFVCGQDNASDATALFIVGNGTSDTSRNNAFTVANNGDTKVFGKLSFNSIDSRSAAMTHISVRRVNSVPTGIVGDYIGQICVTVDDSDVILGVYMYIGVDQRDGYAKWIPLYSAS